jgi:hypothetical protein
MTQGVRLSQMARMTAHLIHHDSPGSGDSSALQRACALAVPTMLGAEIITMLVGEVLCPNMYRCSAYIIYTLCAVDHVLEV